ncbi:LPS export ABC transporter periplasmic protein LptC [Flavobacterium antarcticum]|uniref:LPS export ABC transporter periplasmic protein LptC n=1 Tax=Flavobacterium antarcticum TaxID=271155 RepID=UPI0003B5D491|nr:LPS export ABC transporter periplasmic protein LptC [Flavobacterium antarcticum]
MKKIGGLFSASLLVLLFFSSCESNLKDVQKINLSEFSPSGDADSITLKYTDSGRIKAVLIASKMLDFATVKYPFTEFPKGINVTLYDQKAKRTFIRSDYAIQFKGTDIIDLQGNVKINTEDNQVLETQQLYFDQKNEWFFTEGKFKFTAPKGISNGEGIDFNKDFTIMNTQKFSGEVEQSE